MTGRAFVVAKKVFHPRHGNIRMMKNVYLYLNSTISLNFVFRDKFESLINEFY